MYVTLFIPCHVTAGNVYRKVKLVFFLNILNVIDGKIIQKI